MTAMSELWNLPQPTADSGMRSTGIAICVCSWLARMITMATKLESEFPPSPQNYESDGDEGVEHNDQEEDEEAEVEKQKPVNNNVANILARLQSSGALIKKPKKEFYCFTCKLDYPDWEELENHLIQHVSLPSVVLDKLPSDDEDAPPSGDENWSDEDDEESPPKALPKTPQKIDISQILKSKAISLKKPNDNDSKNTNSALSKLSGLGFIIKSNTTPIKTEKPDSENNDVMQRLGKLGGIKLKLKSDGNNTNTFKVVNGLKDFKASDDEDEDEDKEPDDDNDNDKSGENDESIEEQSSNHSRKPSESDDSDPGSSRNAVLKQQIGTPRKEGRDVTKKITPIKIQEEPKAQERRRPAVKQTPKRGANVTAKEVASEGEITELRRTSVSTTPDRRESNEHTDNVVVKQEVQDPTEESQSSSNTLFSGQVKTERLSPPLPDSSSTPMITEIKTENDAYPPSTTSSSNVTNPLLPVTKTEETMTIIEINGDSNDEDDDCCVVSTTPAPDIKPKIENTAVEPKIETVVTPTYPSSSTFPTSSAYTMPSANYSSSSGISGPPPLHSTQKQHSFNWNAPDSKPHIEMLEKSADDIFDSLLSTSNKKESMLSDASEYISLDKLGSQHTCDVCNTRFTDISLLEDHKRMTGHSQSLVTPSSSMLLPYTPSSNILSSLLPVTQIAEKVGKLSTIGGSGPGFTHQQNFMINIQCPGGGGVMMPPQAPYNQSSPNMQSNYPSTSNMYGQGQAMPGQYQGNNYMGANMPGYGQFSQQMPKTSYISTMPQNTYATPPAYSTSSPLQSMQQSVYGQGSMMNQQPGSMGPPGSPSQPYVAVCSPGGLTKSAGIKIQNVQTWTPGQLGGGSSNVSSGGPGQDMGQMTAPGQPMGGQMPPPTQVRMAANVTNTGPRPRMPGVRGQRPTIRPGIQVHGRLGVGNLILACQ
ncbi:unnamed protein product [Colias eurytheme]|nr:unnamed protein product [Colias eurytheme]